MTTCIARAEAKQIMAESDIATLIWGSPHTRSCQVCRCRGRSALHLLSPCLAMLLNRNPGDDDDVAAILRAEGLLTAVPDAESMHGVLDDRLAWTKAALNLLGKLIVPHCNSGAEHPGCSNALV